MGLKLNNLPEKDFFTIEEIADRWSCGVDTVNHYIFESKILRTAIKTKDIGLTSFSVHDNQFTFLELGGFVAKVYDECVYSTGVFIFIDKLLTSENKGNKLKENVDEINLPQLIETAVRSSEMPKFMYQIQPELLNYDVLCESIKNPYRGTINNPYMENKYLKFYLSVMDFEGNRYLLVDPLREKIIPTFPYKFNIISREERDRFENEFGITEETKNVQNLVSGKTENMYLELIQLFVGSMLRDGLSDNPFTDAGKIERKLASQGKKLPCTKETLAKYLKSIN